MTLNEAMDTYRDMRWGDLKQGTRRAYDGMWERHIKGELGAKNVKELDRKALLCYARKLECGGVTRRTATRCVALTKSVLRCVQDELGVDVAETTWTMRLGRGSAVRKVERFSDAEVAAIMRYCTGSPSATTIGVLLALTTGLRIGELCALRWGDIDVASRTLTVARTLERVGNERGNRRTEIVVNAPKTASGRREVPIMEGVMKLLVMMRWSRQRNYYVASGTAKWREPRSMTNGYYRVLEAVGVRRLKFHALRHTFASMMISKGADAKTVAAILGHSTVGGDTECLLPPYGVRQEPGGGKYLRRNVKRN